MSAAFRFVSNAASTPRRVPSASVQRLLEEAAIPDADALRAYWRKMGKKALKYLARRPLTLVRHARGQVFFHTGPLPAPPPSVHALTFDKREGGKGTRLWVDSVAGLVDLVDLDVIELHPWNATVDDIERPDQMVFDLDPGSGVPWRLVREMALKLRHFLKREGFSSWAKASGGKGLHVTVPLAPDRTHDAVREQSHRLAVRFADTDPRLIAIAARAARPGRIFIDYLRNGRGQTAIGAWSPRARPGFPVAVPLTWKAVADGARADAVTMDDLTDRSSSWR